MTELHRLALFGGTPLFDHLVRPGQQAMPDWTSYEAIFRDIFDRQYYTNHGPLVQSLERRLAEYLDVEHVICMTNEFIALVSVAHALCLGGRIVIPANCPPATSRTLDWTAARPLYCDVDSETGLLTASLVERAIADSQVSAVLAVNAWGDACAVADLEALAKRKAISLYFDSAQGLGCCIGDRRLGSFGNAEVISLHSDNVLSAIEGGVICTENGDLAAYLRNMRSSYGMGRSVPVPKTTNGRMSEAQAALALFGLDHLDQRIAQNERIFRTFQRGIAAIPGLAVRAFHGITKSNYQNLICVIDEQLFGLRRDLLVTVLRSENIAVGVGFCRAPSGPQKDWPDGACDTFPGARRYSARMIELPISSKLTEADAARIVERIAHIQANAQAIGRRLAQPV